MPTFVIAAHKDGETRYVGRPTWDGGRQVYPLVTAITDAHPMSRKGARRHLGHLLGETDARRYGYRVEVVEVDPRATSPATPVPARWT